MLFQFMSTLNFFLLLLIPILLLFECCILFLLYRSIQKTSYLNCDLPMNVLNNMKMQQYQYQSNQENINVNMNMNINNDRSENNMNMNMNMNINEEIIINKINELRRKSPKFSNLLKNTPLSKV